MTIIFSSIYFLSIFYIARKNPLLGLLCGANGFLINGLIGQSSGIGFVLVSLITPMMTFVCVLLNIWEKKRSVYFRLEFDVALLILIFGIQLLSTVFASDGNAALEISIRYAVFCLSYYIFIKVYFQNCSDPKAELRRALSSVYYLGFIFGVIAYLRGESSSEYVMHLSIGNITSIPLSVVVGQSVVIGLVGFFTNTLISKQRLVLTLPPLIYVLALTNTRSTLIACAIVIVFLFALGVGSVKRSRIIPFILLICVSLPLFYFYMSADISLFERSMSGFQRLIDGQYGESEGDRLKAWIFALDAFSSNPILGMGPGNFGQKYIAYPHNIYLEVLSETGIFAFLFLIIVTLYALIQTIHKLEITKLYLGSLFLFSLFISQVSLSLWMHKWLFIWMALLLLFSSLINRNKLPLNTQ